jgi:hypothetical protein
MTTLARLHTGSANTPHWNIAISVMPARENLRGHIFAAAAAANATTRPEGQLDDAESDINVR